MLDVNGFDVHDLGVDVPEAKFVEAVKADKPQVLALSGFLTLAYDSMKSTVEAPLPPRPRRSVSGGFSSSRVAISSASWDHPLQLDRRQHRETLPRPPEIQRVRITRLLPAPYRPAPSDGPRRQAAIMASTTSTAPANTASTLPSLRLRTQPSRPRVPRLMIDEGTVTDALHPAADRDADEPRAGHVTSSPRNSVRTRLAVGFAHPPAPSAPPDGRPFRFFREVLPQRLQRLVDGLRRPRRTARGPAARSAPASSRDS